MFVLKQQQNLGRRFGTSKMHFSPPPPPVALAAVRSGSVVFDLFFNVLAIVCGGSVFLCFVKPCFVSILVLQSS